MNIRTALVATAIVACLPGLANAQASRTWVSGVGDDANPCSRTAPCKTFAGAISKTAPKGEISVLDPGGFGAVTITKSMSIVADGDLGGVLSSLVSGITINAAATDDVYLQGLDIEGFGNGINGIRILQAGSVSVKNTIIRDFATSGINVDSSAVVRLYLDNVQIYNSTVGLTVKTISAVNAVTAFIDNSTIIQNDTTGIRADGAQAKVVLSDSYLANGVTGAFNDISLLNGGTVASYGNNVIRNGNPSSTQALE